MLAAMSAQCGHGNSFANGPGTDKNTGPYSAPYGFPLNPVPEVYKGMAATGAAAGQ